MKSLLLSLPAVLLLTAGAAALPGDEPLGVGMKAPTLDQVNWIKGDKVAAWQPGQVYVLDFWATWCPPCKKSIPHINELAQKYRSEGVHFIGVAVAPRPDMVPTDQFVAEKGAEMDYLIAEDIDGQTNDTFMDSARCYGIPTIMIVDRKGELAWIGSPFTMDETLAQIVAGTDDRAAAVAADAARREPLEAQYKIDSALRNYDKLDPAKAAELLKTCEKQLAEDPKNPQLAYNKYKLLAKAGPKEAASAFGMEIVKDQLKDIPKGLNLLAWGIVDPASKAPLADRDIDLALAAAARADELTSHRDASIIDTLARAHFWKGDVAKAIELQTKAVEVAAAEQKSELQSTLDEYQKAAPRPAGG